MLASDIATLRAFVDQVIERADQSAKEMVPVTLAVVGGILWRADPGSIGMQQGDDGYSNVLWASFGEQRMVFSYNDMTAVIELREDSLNGHPMYKFSYRSLQMDIEKYFDIDEK